MYPHERSLVKKLADEPFEIIGVNSEDSTDKLRGALEREGITWPSFFDGGGTDGPIAVRWGVTGWPTIYVLDHEGVIRAIGPRGEQLDAVLEELLPLARAARDAAAAAAGESVEPADGSEDGE